MPMPRPLPLALLLPLTLLAGCEIGGRRAADGAEGEGEGAGEGEGEGTAEGEGEGPAEGEGEGPAEGEGEGPAEGEGEGPAEGEGEGTAEGEGEGPAEGEGEGPGDPDAGYPPEDAGPRPPSLVGVINATQVYAEPFGEAYRGNGGAFFDETGEPPDFEGCRVVPSGDAPSQTSYHAGVLRVTGGRQDLVLTPAPTADGRWVYGSSLPETNGRLFEQGDRLVFTGEGGPHAGPFGVEIVAPDRVAVTAPTMFQPPRQGQAVRVRWTADESDGVLLTLAAKRGGLQAEAVPGNTILCGTPDDGSEEIPADLMGQLPDGDGFILGVARVRLAEVEIDERTSVVATAIMAAGLVYNYQ